MATGTEHIVSPDSDCWTELSRDARFVYFSRVVDRLSEPWQFDRASDTLGALNPGRSVYRVLPSPSPASRSAFRRTAASPSIAAAKQRSGSRPTPSPGTSPSRRMGKRFTGSTTRSIQPRGARSATGIVDYLTSDGRFKFHLLMSPEGERVAFVSDLGANVVLESPLARR